MGWNGEEIEPQGIINGICMGLFHILKDASGESKTIHLSVFEPSTMKTWSRMSRKRRVTVNVQKLFGPWFSDLRLKLILIVLYFYC